MTSVAIAAVSYNDAAHIEGVDSEQPHYTVAILALSICQLMALHVVAIIQETINTYELHVLDGSSEMNLSGISLKVYA